MADWLSFLPITVDIGGLPPVEKLPPKPIRDRRENDSEFKRRMLVSEVGQVDDLAGCFDLSAFPLPIRVGVWEPAASHCWSCRQDALHVYMRIRPRSDKELFMIPRDEKGMFELNTCTFVTQAIMAKEGNLACVERIRVKIKEMVMHEVYEALLFRGERIMNPHDHDLRPAEQPF